MPTSATTPAMSAPVRARCFGVGVDGAGGGVTGGASVGSFALHEAFWRRVTGVSDPHVVQFPLLGGGEAGVVEVEGSSVPHSGVTVGGRPV